MNRLQMRNSGLLLLAAFIWGIAFTAQSVAGDYVGPFTFNFVRSILGGLFLLLVILVFDRKKVLPEKTKKRQKEQKQQRKILVTGGICCGILLWAAANLQQFGIMSTTAGKAGFITACYIVIVPVLGIFLKKKCTVLTWIAVALAMVGLYLLCITDSLTIEKGDVLLLCCSFLFSLHILVIDHFSPLVNGVKMSCIQFFVCGILSGIAMIFTEHPQIADILLAWVPILYAGILSCGVAYTLQIVGQKDMNPAVASLIFSLESGISVLAGWLILGQRLSGREAIGCFVMLGATVLAQIHTAK